MDRRTILTGAAAAAGFSASACASTQAASERSRHLAGATFVLVHGAWHGGWCWRDVQALLTARGARVFCPTLTGLGERAHLRDPVPSLAMHIQDVVGLIKAEELDEVVLVGHSYGGMVITGVADRFRARMRHVVYLDAAVPKDGQSFASQAPDATPETIAATEAQFRTLAPDGQWMGVFPPVVLGVPPENAAATAWLSRRLTPHPLRTWLDSIALPNGGAQGLARTYVLCTAPVMRGASFAAHAARLKNDPTWRYREIATGHDAMVLEPAKTAALLAEAAL
jgi:pimeloyl-ACP methyl ester carboxylesterase